MHTQLPWHVLEDSPPAIRTTGGYNVCPEVCNIEDAAHIVRCVNSHAALVAALEEMGKQLQARVEAAGHVIWGPSDIRAAEDGEPAWVCNARGAFGQARAALALAKEQA